MSMEERARTGREASRCCPSEATRQPGPAACPPHLPDDWARSFFDEGFEETFRRLGKYDATEAEADQIVALLGLDSGCRVLDIPCGFGRHAGALSSRGVEVVGLDSSPAQVSEARRRYPQVCFLLGDMRQPPDGPFDAVLNLWSSFGYLESRAEDFRALKAWAAVLKPHGRLIMELTDLELAEFENRQSSELRGVRTTLCAGVTREAWFDWEERVAYYRYSRRDWSRICKTRIYSRAELVDSLLECGFRCVRCSGNLQGAAKQPRDRLVLLAEK
jgi:SAM-dependent methyltransferase